MAWPLRGHRPQSAGYALPGTAKNQAAHTHYYHLQDVL